MKKIHFIDTYSTDELHELFNSSTLLMFSNIYDEIEYYASKTSSRNTEKIINPFPRKITIHKIPVISYEPGIRAVVKQLLATIVNLYYVVKIPKSDLIIYNYNTILALKPINIINRFLKKKIIIICHGELESLGNISDNTFGGRMLKSFFLNPNLSLSDSLYFFVLGKSIRKNVIELVNEQFVKHFFSFEHTAIFKEKVIKKNRETGSLNVTFLGSLRSNKGSNQIFNLVKRFENNREINFSIIGRIRTDTSELIKLGINFIKDSDKRFLSRDQIDNEMANQDLILFMYPISSYKYTASGALLDAIGYEKPIVSLPNDYFTFLIEHRACAGKILFNENEIFNYLSSMIYNNLPVYDYKEIKTLLSPINEAINVSETLRSLKLL